MSKQTVLFEFSIGESVLVKAIGMTAVIDSLVIDNMGPMYRIVYWNDGVRKSEHVYGREIVAIEGGKE